MSKLSKWFPFRFERNKDRKSDDSSTQVAVHPATPPRGRAEAMGTLMHPALFWQDPFQWMGEIERFFGDFAPTRFAPSIDLVDEGKHVRLTAELPGVEKDDIELTVDDDVLTLRGQKRQESESKEDGCYRLERYFGRFQRMIPLPSDVVADGIEATFDKGVLTVRLPKAQADKPGRAIPIR